MEISEEDNLINSLLYNSDNEDFISDQPDSDKSPISSQSKRNDSTSTTSINRRGRHLIRFTKRSKLFYYGKGIRNPKKEYISTSIIRAIRKGFRFIIKGNTPTRSCIAINIKCSEESDIWHSLQEIYRENPEIIEKIACTKNGSIGDSYKCYTNSYCQEFFSNIYMQRAFNKLIKLIFNDCTCSRCDDHSQYRNLSCGKCCDIYCSRCCSRFKFYCCNNENNPVHSSGCLIKWNKIRKYFMKKYLKDLNVEVLPGGDSVFYEDQELDMDYSSY